MKKIKLKNNSKKKSYKKSIFKLFLFVLLIYISYSLTFNYLNKKNIDVRDKKYVDYLLENSYNNKNSKILLEEGIKLVSNINLKDPKTLLDSKIKNNPKQNEVVYEKDKTAIDDDYDNNVYSKITSYVENMVEENENPIIYLYNTQQLETYSSNGFESTNIKPNVLMTSYLLSEKLNKSGISTITEDTNINEFIRVSGIKDNDFYSTTRIFIKDKMGKYSTLIYYIDIHRDAVSKKISTANINGKDYARVLFVLGTNNPNYLENKKLMESLDNISDELYPGLSRGIFERKAIYNQDLNNNVILIEIGAKENTMEEVMNTVEALSNIIIKYIKG